MTKILPFSERLDCDVTKPFTDRLEPILNQMKAANIAEQYQPVVLFSLTNGKARDAAEKVNIYYKIIDALVDHVKNLCLFEKDIQGRCSARWNEITYADFHSRHATEDAATRACIDHVMSYCKDLPRHFTL